VLIWHLRGERKALDLIRHLRDIERFELWIGAMQRAEVVFFMRPEEEKVTELLWINLSSIKLVSYIESGIRVLESISMMPSLQQPL